MEGRNFIQLGEVSSPVVVPQQQHLLDAHPSIRQGATGAARTPTNKHLVLAEGPATSAWLISKKRKEVKVANKPKRHRQIGSQQCLLCRKMCFAMRNHLMKVHKVEMGPRKFLISFYRTRDVKIPVYQCNTCVVRFTNPWRDHKGHEVIRVRDTKIINTLPASIKGLISKGSDSSRKTKPVVDDYNEYHGDGIVNCTRRLLTELMTSTEHLQNPKAFRNFVLDWKNRNGYKAKTTVSHLTKIKKFLRFVSLYHSQLIRNKNLQWDAVQQEAREEYRKASAKEEKMTTIRLFEKVPSMKECQTMRRKVKEALNDNLEDDELTYKEAAAMIFFLLQSSLNIRPGPRLRMKTAEYKDMVSDTVYPSNDHKTGQLYTIGVMIRESYRPFVNQIVDKFEMQQKMKPVFVFSTNSGGGMTSICELINTVLDDKFGCNGKSYGPTSIRKMWETFRSKSTSFKEQHGNAHTSQSGHCDKTAKRFYVQPPSLDEMKGLLDFYEEAIDKCEDEEIPPESERGTTKSTTPATTSNTKLGKISQNKEGKKRMPMLEASEKTSEDSDSEKDSPSTQKNRATIKKQRNTRACTKVEYYESDLQSDLSAEDSSDDMYYEDTKENKCKTKIKPSYLLLASSNKPISSDNKVDNSPKKATLAVTGIISKREMFVNYLKPVKEKMFSDVDKLVLESFNDLTVRPKVAMVREKYASFINSREIDEMGLRRVFRKLERAWSQFMTN